MKVTFLGAGSTIFAKNVLGDILMTKEISSGLEIALHDIDAQRLDDSFKLISFLNEKYNGGKAHITAHIDRRKSLAKADFIVNAIQVGGYEPSTVIDFEIPKKYGLRQTIGDTLGIGGIMRALRTAPVLDGFEKDIHDVASPDALFINYTNPMSMLTLYLNHLKINSVGLCHSVQVCVSDLLKMLGLNEYLDNVKWEISGINHMAWLRKITDLKGNDLYPLIKRKSKEEIAKKDRNPQLGVDLVRHEIMHRFGYYVTESSEHNAEYTSYFIKNKHPELIKDFNIPLDEYPRRCVCQINDWQNMRKTLINNPDVEHVPSREFAAHIIKATVMNTPYLIHGNVINTNGYIGNLPKDACVEIPCFVDSNGIQPVNVGDLPQQLAALNRTNINVHLVTLEAMKTRSLDAVYQAAYLDPHTSSELTLDEIRAMCDELIAAHGNMLPKFV